MTQQVEVSGDRLMAVEAGNEHVHPLIAGVLRSVAPAPAKRTPGPWRVEEATADETTGLPHYHYIVAHKDDEDWRCVASTWSRPNIHDATLISLAPELADSLADTLKLLRKAQDILSLYLQPDSYDDLQCCNLLLELLDGPEQRAIEKPARALLAKLEAA